MDRHPENHHRYQIICRVLQSKRMLTDHVEILEDYINLKQITRATETTIRPILSTLAVIGFGAGSFKLGTCRIFRPVLGILTIGLGTFVCKEGLSLFKHRRSLQLLTKLLDTLNAYHVVIKTNLNYLNEISLLGSGIESVINEQLTESSISSLVTVVTALHVAVQEWDSQYSLTEELGNYQPFENFDWTSYLDDPNSGSSKRLKELFNIFIFIQSQFILRTTIVLIENVDRDLSKKLIRIVGLIRDEIQRKDLRLLAINKQESGKIHCSDFIADSRTTSQYSKLRWTCSNLNTYLWVQLNEFEGFHQRLYSLTDNQSVSLQKKNIKLLNEHLDNLENIFNVSYNEFNSAQKILRNLLNNEDDDQLPIAEVDKQEGDSTKITTVDQGTQLDIHDEFYVLAGQMGVDDNIPGADSQIEMVGNERLLKSRFTPVLKQLKREINPLKEDMALREKNYLKSQGIECEESSEDSDDDSSIEEMPVPAVKVNKYEENRKFLEDKVPIRVFQLPLVFGVSNEEDVIE